MSCLDVDNDTNLMKFNNEHSKGVWFVWFYANWCGHCMHMMPHWDELANNNKHGVRLAKVRDDFIPKLNTTPPVEGYPTIILYKDGNVEETYRGERSGDAFNNFLGEKISNNNNNNNNNNNTDSVSQMNNVVRLEKPKKKKSKSQKKKSKKSAKKSAKKSKTSSNNKNKKKSKSKKSKSKNNN